MNSFFSKKNPIDISHGRFDSGVNPEINFIFYVGINYALDEHGIPYQNISIEEIEKNLFLENNGNFYKGKFCNNFDCMTGPGDRSFLFSILQKKYLNPRNQILLMLFINAMMINALIFFIILF